MRKRNQDRTGIAMILFVMFATVAMLNGAYMVDASRGISADQSMRAAGL